MNLLASLFMTQLLYVIGIGGVQDKELCVGLIFGVQYIRMTVWTWLLIMIRNTYQNFSVSLSVMSPIDPKITETFWKSSLVGCVLRFQRSNCSLLTGYAFTFAFLIPTLFIFVLVVWYLWKIFVVIKKNVCIQHSKKARDKIHSRRMLQLSLFIKIGLIVSSVTLFSILYAVTEREVFWFIFNILQGLQGIFIAFCVTCNRQVLKMYTRPLRKIRQGRGSYDGILSSDLSISTSLQILTLEPTPDIV
ncbi:UNVERIFIED_CONTAM: hypothetical protein PYX00_007989 [Menopon gallinae]|uniref:G-protein coupled receptors family 2 profile 2 domain-containing protein n=1 Tax=Menopon gallinae TaxID=328185 RepID=A0AAW2HL51_9NEOP